MFRKAKKTRTSVRVCSSYWLFSGFFYTDKDWRVGIPDNNGVVDPHQRDKPGVFSIDTEEVGVQEVIVKRVSGMTHF